MSMAILFLFGLGASLSGGAVNSARKELVRAVAGRWALAAMQTARTVVEELPKHRGMANALLRGDTSFGSKLQAQQSRVQQCMAEANKTFAAPPYQLRVEKMLADWRDLSSTVMRLQPDASFARHTQLIAQWLELLEDVCEDAALGQLGDRSMNVLAGLLGSGIPIATETMGQARGLGTGALAQGGAGMSTRVRIKFLHQRMRDVMEQSLEPAHRALSGSSVLAGAAQAEFGVSLANGRQFLQAMQTELVDARHPQMSPDAFYRLGTAAIESHFKLFDALLPSAKTAVENSIADLTNAVRIRMTMLVVWCIAMTGIAFAIG